MGAGVGWSSNEAIFHDAGCYLLPLRLRRVFHARLALAESPALPSALAARLPPVRPILLKYAAIGSFMAANITLKLTLDKYF